MKLKTMEEALIRYPNRFQLTMMATARAKELNRYRVDRMDLNNSHRVPSGEEPLVAEAPERKPVVVAIREIAEGKVVAGDRDEMDKIREARRIVREKILSEAESAAVEEEDKEVETVPDGAGEAEGEADS